MHSWCRCTLLKAEREKERDEPEKTEDGEQGTTERHTESRTSRTHLSSETKPMIISMV